MKLLILSIIFPYPSNQGSSLRMAANLETLARYHEVYFLSFTKKDVPKPFYEHAKRFCKEVKIVQVRRFERLANGILALFSPLPISVGIWRNREMKEQLRKILSRIEFEGVFIFDLKMAPYLDYFKGNIKTYIDLDISYSRYYLLINSFLKGPRRFLYRLEQRRMKQYEEKNIEAADGCFIASDVDRNSFPEHFRKNIRILPNVIDVDDYTFFPRTTPDSGKILFSGRFSYAPNVDGAVFFRREIFPYIERHSRSASFWIVGANPSKDIMKLHDNKRVFVTGYVENMKTYLHQSDVFVCPLRFGGGTRLKILEAMAAGLPVVTTSPGCEGLKVKNGTHLFIENDPASFARRVIEILEGRIDVLEMCRNARNFVQRFHKKTSLEIEGLTVPCMK